MCYREFIELNEWQIQELKDSIKEADAHDFASEQEVDEVFNKWKVNADLMATDSLEKPRPGSRVYR